MNSDCSLASCRRLFSSLSWLLSSPKMSDIGQAWANIPSLKGRTMFLTARVEMHVCSNTRVSKLCIGSMRVAVCAYLDPTDLVLHEIDQEPIRHLSFPLFHAL